MEQYTPSWDYSAEDIAGNLIDIKGNATYKASYKSEGSSNQTVTITDPETKEQYTFELDKLLDINIANYSYMSQEDILNKINEGEAVVFGHNGEQEEYITDVNGKQIKIDKTHAYSVMNFDGKNVTLVNPHDTNNAIIVSLDEISKLNYTLSLYEF